MKLDEKTINKEKEALIIRKYQQYLKLEKALSANTLDAYLTDLDKLLRFLKAENIDMLSVTLDDLQRFAAGLHDIGIHPRSQARIMSGIKSFFHFLIMADYREDDPSELLEGPKIGFKLPEVLTVEEIDTIIATVDMSKKEGQRNRAILETLYSCGLRVSELCNLKLSELYFDEGFIKVEGKGSKQRLVPISPRAIKEIKYWLLDRNVGKIKKGVGGESRYHQKYQPAHLPSFLRYPLAGRRREPACHTMYAGTRVHRNNRNLYPYRPEYVAE